MRISNEAYQYYEEISPQFTGDVNLDFYEDFKEWNVVAGEYILDYNFPVDSADLTSGILYRVIKNDSLPSGQNVILLKKVNDAYGVSFHEADLKKMRHALSEYIKHRKPEENKYGNIVEIKFEELRKELAPYLKI